MASSRTRWIGLAIVLTSLALSAGFLARGATALVAARFLPLDPSAGDVPERPVTRASDGPGDDARKDPMPLLARNVFDHALGDLTRPPPVEPVAVEGPAEVVDPSQLPFCEGSMRLAATLVHPVRPELSIATITDATGKALLYRTRGGENVVDGRTVVSILPFAVHLRPDGGSLCQLAMFDQGAPTTATVRRAAEEPPPQPQGEGEDPAIAAGIRQVTENQYRVDRALVDRLLTNQAELMRSARIIPHSENGRVVGVKLYGIRRNSVLSRLGLQNGDMLRTINGFDMTSPDKALEAYTRLRSADTLSVNVVRRGEATTLDYTIE